ncbi:DUF4145 domain-containing protein [Rossellomorea arthrocnemi]|uniref:DUF4145 domain-containing protein n=1 Tax=Rossellomorea arthrocnemi TaxID=2769542 RepID=UPI00191B65B3|nr:DUF4145 domain-containing protein [Rossellomorea arthrocnemi]
MNHKYFYQFLEPLSNELALLGKELEHSVFTSPRTMLTHSRVFIENILKSVMKEEGLSEVPLMTIVERINFLNEQGILIKDVLNDLHSIRMTGNQAAHQTRMFRYSESLTSWEALYNVIKWYIESYGPISTTVPEYKEPCLPRDEQLDLDELLARLVSLEKTLSAKETPTMQAAHAEVAATITDEGDPTTEGYSTIRRISYMDKHVDIPFFLRDAFLLPQRFQKSETFLIRLGEVQQARFVSELPHDLVDLHKHVKRYNEKNDKTLFEELSIFVQEELTRREITHRRRGELLFFYKSDYIVVTEELSAIPLSPVEFSGIHSLLKQLKQNGILTVGQLPKELVSLAKYANVGTLTIEKLFDQIKGKQAR